MCLSLVGSFVSRGKRGDEMGYMVGFVRFVSLFLLPSTRHRLLRLVLFRVS